MSDLGMLGGDAPFAGKTISLSLGKKAKKKDHGDYDYEGRMTKSNLYNLAKHATMMHDLISDNEDLEPWVQEKIAVATEAIETVAEYMEYEKVMDGED